MTTTNSDHTHLPTNWGRWGSKDEAGTLNLVTDQVRARAVAGGPSWALGVVGDAGGAGADARRSIRAADTGIICRAAGNAVHR